MRILTSIYTGLNPNSKLFKLLQTKSKSSSTIFKTPKTVVLWKHCSSFSCVSFSILFLSQMHIFIPFYYRSDRICSFSLLVYALFHFLVPFLFLVDCVDCAATFFYMCLSFSLQFRFHIESSSRQTVCVCHINHRTDCLIGAVWIWQRRLVDRLTTWEKFKTPLDISRKKSLPISTWTRKYTKIEYPHSQR